MQGNHSDFLQYFQLTSVGDSLSLKPTLIVACVRTFHGDRKHIHSDLLDKYLFCDQVKKEISLTGSYHFLLCHIPLHFLLLFPFLVLSQKCFGSIFPIISCLKLIC